jgi:O-antigen/teichoic acid export membrane protein
MIRTFKSWPKATRLAIGVFIDLILLLLIVYTHSQPLAFQLMRLVVIGLGLFAMWSLFVAYRERHHEWTTKLFKIWICQLGWAIAAVEGNIELFYRHSRPSWAIFLVMFLLILTALGVFDPSKYTKTNT